MVKNVATKSPGVGNFLKTGKTEAGGKFELQTNLVRKMLSQKKEHSIKTNYK